MTHDQFMESLLAVMRKVAREVYAEERAAPSPDELLTVGEAASLASLKPATIRAWVKSRRLREHRAGRHLRIERGDLERALKLGHRDQGPSPEELARRAADRILRRS